MNASSSKTPKQARRAVLPDVTRLHLRDAKVVLRSAGFETFSVHYVEDYLEDFHIVQQEPNSGILVDRAREIALTVSRTNPVIYLPQVYQQVGAQEGSFLTGFLYIIQTLYDRISGRLERIHELFDPRSTDPEFLPWLASWLAIALNSEWSELQARKMLMAATKLFPLRGTSRAIEEFVRIYTGADVQIEENTWPFKGFRVGASSTIGMDTVILPPMNLAHCFVVRLDRPAENVPEDEIIRIHQIIQNQKPAHTMYFLAFSDETAAGEMGAFMEIGEGAIGVGGIGIGAADEPPVVE